MPKMTPQSFRMHEELNRQGYGLTNGERQTARADRTHALTGRCTVRTRTVTADDFGGQTATWTDTYVDVPCRLLSTGGAFGFGDERVFAGRLVHQADYLLLLPYDQALATTDRVASIADPDGVVKEAGPLEVLATGHALSDRTTLQALVRRVQ